MTSGYCHKLALFFCFILPLLTSCESRKVIVNSQYEREANEIVVFLTSRGIDASKVASPTAGGGGAKGPTLFDISVPAEQATEAMSLLNQAGLPRKPSQNLLGIFANVGLVPSEIEQKIRYQAGLAEQIASTIRKIDGVLDAEVQISFPEENPLNPTEKKEKPTASVYVKHNGVLDDPNSHLTTKIKSLVAASVPNLDFNNVTVIPDRARFSEQPAGFLKTGEEEKHYVSVWSLIIAQESLNRFRIVFFTFTLIILFLLLSVIWLAWKIYPLMKTEGGLKGLFTLHPYKGVPSTPEAKKEEEGKKAEVKAKETEEKGLVDEDIDET